MLCMGGKKCWVLGTMNLWGGPVAGVAPTSYALATSMRWQSMQLCVPCRPADARPAHLGALNATLCLTPQ